MKYILAVLILWSLNGFGQEFKGINFEDETFCWQDYYWNDSLSAYKQDYILAQGPALIDDKYLLVVANYNVPDKEGYIVHLKDILTGEIVWERTVFSEVQYTRQFANNFLIKEGILELYLFEEAKNAENIVYPPWYEGHIALQKLDVYTGAILEEVRTDHDDPNNVAHWVSTHAQRPFIGYVDSLFRVVDVSYGFSSFAENRTIGFSAISLLNDKGHLVEADTTFYEWTYCRRPFFTIHAWFDHKGNYSKIIGGQLLNDSICGISVLIKDFTTVQAVEIPSILQEKPAQHVLSSSVFNGETYSICAGTPYIDHNTRYTGSCYIFTKEGDLLDSLSVSYILSEGDQRYNVMVDLDANQIYQARKFDEEDATKFQFYQRNQEGYFDTILNIKTLDQDFVVFNLNSFYLGNNKFMFNVKHRQPSIPPESDGASGPLFHYNSVLDLNKKTNNLEEVSEPQISIYPNPTLSDVYIESNEHIAAWQLSSMCGVLVASGKRPEKQIDLGGVAVGSYILTLITGNNSMRNFKLIKSHSY